MVANYKFRRIARDLEKLPCELHEEILVDIEFHQLIRLFSCAGARLKWSLENSPSPWSFQFRGKNTKELQKLLAITDKIQRFCCPVPKWQRDSLHIFEYLQLDFLSWKSSQWKKVPKSTIEPQKLRNGKMLARHWLETLNQTVYSSTFPAFHDRYAYLVEPWAAELSWAKETIKTIVDKFAGRMFIEPKTFFTTDELALFMELYQQARLKKAEAFVRELHRLAELYEKYATQLKMPFDPRPYPPNDLNTTHVPTMMRRQARRIMNIAENTAWHGTDKFMHRFAWPALVPYDWCAQLFNEIALKPGFLERDTTNDPTAATMKQMCHDILTKRPLWSLDIPEVAASKAKTGADAITMTHQHQVSLQVSLPHPIRICVSIKNKSCSEERVLLRGDEELQWLEKFARVTAYLEEEYPKLVQE